MFLLPLFSKDLKESCDFQLQRSEILGLHHYYFINSCDVSPFEWGILWGPGVFTQSHSILQAARTDTQHVAIHFKCDVIACTPQHLSNKHSGRMSLDSKVPQCRYV